MSVLPDTKALLTFGGRFLLIFFFTIPLWFVFVAPYNRLLASAANITLGLIEEPRTTTLVGWKNNIAIVRRDNPLTKGVRLQGFTGYLTHFNVIFLVALVLAPQKVGWGRRCKILAVGLAILFVTHVLYLVVGVTYFQQPELEAFRSPLGSLSVWGVNFYLSVASQLVPVLIWMGLYRTVGLIPGEEPTVGGEPAAGGETG
jgi:hypothetical protein